PGLELDSFRPRRSITNGQLAEVCLNTRAADVQTVQARLNVELKKTSSCFLGNDHGPPATLQLDRQLLLGPHLLTLEHDGELKNNSAPLVHLRKQGKCRQQDQDGELDTQTHGIPHTPKL